MKQMAAASCNERASNSTSAKEVAAKLAQIQAERARQDEIWAPKSESSTNDQLPTKKYETQIALPNGSVA